MGTSPRGEEDDYFHAEGKNGAASRSMRYTRLAITFPGGIPPSWLRSEPENWPLEIARLKR